MKMPDEQDIEIAAQWLRYNEGDRGEAEACKRVADWIDYMDHERLLREQARALGVTVARLRRRLKEQDNR